MRIRFRYSLRVLLLCWILIGIGLAWAGVKWREAKRQEAALETLKNSWQCHVDYADYDPPSSGGCFPVPREPTFTDHMVDRFGVDFLYDVEHLTIYGMSNEATARTPFERWELLQTFPHLKSLEVFDYPEPRQAWTIEHHPAEVTESVRALKGLRELEEVIFSGFTFSKSQLAAFKDHPHLEDLDLSNSNIEPDALSGIETLPQLKILRVHIDASLSDGHLSFLKMPGADLFSLPACPNLEILDLHSVPCTGQIMQGLSNFPKLRTLYLNEFKVTPAAISSLQKLHQLKLLSLESTHLSDEDCAQVIRALPGLTAVNLAYTSAGLQTLRALSELPNIVKVKLNDTPTVSYELSEELAEHLPDVEIDRNDDVFGSQRWIEVVDPEHYFECGLFSDQFSETSDDSIDPFALPEKP